jgi:aminopeptidase N
MLLGKMKGLRGLAFSTLTVSEAQTRAKLIKTGTVRYNSHLTLHKGTSYQGLTNISFETQSQYSLDHLRIDFQGKKLEGLMINDKVLEQPSQYHREGTIKVPTQYLRLGQANNVVVSYQNHYDQDGNGCVSFIDTDQKQYLYTQFEPYYANRVFPLLDQPDIKAPLSLTLACPADWEAVLSN